MAKMTIIEGNSNDKDNVRAYMVKGEAGVSPTFETSKTGDTATITITDAEGTHEVELKDGFSPTVTASKTNKVTTVTITDIDGTEVATISDGIDLTGGVPTNAVIGFDGNASNIPDGYELSAESFGGGLPIGAITEFAGSTAPSGYLLCDGSAISRNDYENLYNVIGVTYGAGDGSTTFNLPNLKGKVPVGLDSSDTDFDTLGETGGSKTHYHSQTLRFSSAYANGQGCQYTNGSTVATDTKYTGESSSLPPYIVLNYIIKY